MTRRARRTSGDVHPSVDGARVRVRSAGRDRCRRDRTRPARGAGEPAPDQRTVQGVRAPDSGTADWRADPAASEDTTRRTRRRTATAGAAWRMARPPPPAEQRYGPGNVANLLRLLRGDLRGVDLSRLALRQVYLQGVDAQDASLAGAGLVGAVMDESFN